MALELPFGVKPVNPVPVEFWSGPYSGVLTQEAINAANSGIPSAVRFPGMGVTLNVSGVSKPYWYCSGISDVELKPLYTNVDYIDFEQKVEADHPAYLEGRIFYDAENHCVTVYNDESEISLQVGQEEYIRIRNNTGSTISNGKAVYITGAQGQHTTVDLATATEELKSEAVGIATHDIENNSFGYITTFGLVRGIDTTAFTEGDELFVSVTDGELTNTSPIAPNYKTSVGHVVVAGNNGSILVTPRDHKLGGGDAKTLGNISNSGIAFFEQITNDGDAGILASDPSFFYDSGNDRLHIGAGGIRFDDGTTQTTAGGGGGTTYTAGSGLTLVGTEFNVYGGSGHFANLEIEPNAATDTGLIVQGAASQTANLQEWQDSSENVLSHVDSTGIYTNVVGSSGTDILRVKYGDERSDFDGSISTEVTGVWLDFEDGTEYTAGTVGAQSLVLGTWYNNTKTIPSRIKISATAFNISLANSQKLDIQGTTAKFNTDVLPFTTMARDLGSESLVWRNVYASGLSASGVELLNHVPADTTNKLYNQGGTLKFNGSTVGGGGGGNRTFNNISADFSMGESSDAVFLDTSSGPINVELPTAVGQGGKELLFKLKAGSSSGILVGSGTQTIDGESYYPISYVNQSIQVISDNSNWLVI